MKKDKNFLTFQQFIILLVTLFLLFIMFIAVKNLTSRIDSQEKSEYFLSLIQTSISAAVTITVALIGAWLQTRRQLRSEKRALEKNKKDKKEKFINSLTWLKTESDINIQFLENGLKLLSDADGGKKDFFETIKDGTNFTIFNKFVGEINLENKDFIDIYVKLSKIKRLCEAGSELLTEETIRNNISGGKEALEKIEKLTSDTRRRGLN